jgi:asparagine synthase (glutamine-hydrolysing)
VQTLAVPPPPPPTTATVAVTAAGAAAMGAAPGAPATLGKMPLRRAFPHVFSAWRKKEPIEVGSGTTGLGARPWLGQPGHFDAGQPGADPSLAPAGAFEAEAARIRADDGVALRDREHLALFRLFRAAFPEHFLKAGEALPLAAAAEGGRAPASAGPPPARGGPLACPACGFALRNADANFCVTCGHYDANMPAVLLARAATGAAAAAAAAGGRAAEDAIPA